MHDATSPFAFSTIPEKTMVRFFKLMGATPQKSRDTQLHLVDDRNDAAHPNGVIKLNSQKSLDLKIADILRVMKEIHSHMESLIAEHYRSFLLESANVEDREYLDRSDQVREILINQHYLSREDLRVLFKIDIRNLADGVKQEEIMELSYELAESYG